MRQLSATRASHRGRKRRTTFGNRRRLGCITAVSNNVGDQKQRSWGELLQANVLPCDGQVWPFQSAPSLTAAYVARSRCPGPLNGGDERNNISVRVKARKEWWKRRSFSLLLERGVCDLAGAGRVIGQPSDRPVNGGFYLSRRNPRFVSTQIVKANTPLCSMMRLALPCRRAACDLHGRRRHL